ncbi:yeats-domain-containing protein [Sistotremastrum niveocremeum HHB9708]|uniref:Protein AF-9 homolog n=1 Tax=Sistotremastrum niveocremeum HHB9708 TaxID=1314777 RepID=A0A164ZKW6_9AGAM|nr:yeats-domain-containing protein [Sistotremastrum niveocremeum HHB9708]
MSGNDKVRVRGLSVHRPIIYGNTAWLLTPEERATVNPDHTHRWTVALRSAASAPGKVGDADDLSYFIKRVTFKLHETYPTPNRNIDKPPFEVTETGWGEFEIHIRITFVVESGEKPISFYHHLKLHPWGPKPNDPASGEPPAPSPPLSPIHSWKYDEIVFSEPFQVFLNTLNAHPPTPLPKTKRSLGPGTSENSFTDGTEAPEFTQDMEKEEADRLEAARKAVIAETDKRRAQLIEKEQELERLKKAVADAQ